MTAYNNCLEKSIQGVPKNEDKRVTADVANQFACMYRILPIRTFEGTDILVMKDFTTFYRIHLRIKFYDIPYRLVCHTRKGIIFRLFQNNGPSVFKKCLLTKFNK